MTRRVVHYKRTPLALAPDALCAAIAKYSNWESRLIEAPDDLPRNAERLVHFHNCYLPYDGPQLIQYHSEPTCPNLMLDFPGRKLVIAQYHAALPEYKDCRVVKNLIDWHLPLFDQRPVTEFRIGYSPSITGRVNQWYDKGFAATRDILQRLRAKFRWLAIDIITSVPYDECIQRKAKCSIIIDECVTGSYHRSGLEGLALGKLTIAWISKSVARVLKQATESKELPFLSVHIDQLEKELTHILENWSLEDLKSWGEKSRQWMEAYWSPEEIVDEFTSIYEQVLREQGN